MADKIKIKKGLDIPLSGRASDHIVKDTQTGEYAIYPDDYPGITWKAAVKIGDTVQGGSPIFRDKNETGIFLVSPVSGSIKDIKRGERRHIEFISIEKKGDETLTFLADDNKEKSSVIKLLQESGIWCLMRQRPYDIVPEPEAEPRDIFITDFDSAPLAGNLRAQDSDKWLEEGLKALSILTPGKVYFSTRDINFKSDYAQSIVVEGPHPAGNVGTQIAAIKPVNKGEVVWTMDSSTVVRIGKLIVTGKPDFSTIVSLTGPEVKDPHKIETTIGASIDSLTRNQLKSDNGIRIISGNVLTGIKVSESDFLHYPYRQITVIKEGDDKDEFMGWASMNPTKYSVKRSFPAFLNVLKKPFDFDARIKGGKRAMILSGEYDKVFPFDIYPEFLLKAIMAGDIERMEKLGIYEVAPEDFALPEFVDTSKNELQKIVREGLDNLRKELS